MTWIDKLTAGISTTTTVASIVAVTSEPGWNVIGEFPMDATLDATLDVMGSVSDASLTLTALVYCVTAGSVGEVAGSRAQLTSTIGARVFSGRFRLTSGMSYQVRAQVVGNAGDNFFGLVRRAAPTPLPI